MRKVVVAVLAASLPVTSSVAADPPQPASPTGQVDCSTEIAAPANASDAVKSTYTKIAEQCAEIRLRSVRAQVTQSRALEISQALSGFSALKGDPGTNTAVDKVGHIAEWLAKEALYDAGRKAGKEVSPKIGTNKFVVATDPAVLASRPRLTGVMARMTRQTNTLEASIRAAHAQLKAIPSAGAAASGPGKVSDDGQDRSGLLALLSVIPPAITAAQSLVSLGQQSANFQSVTVNVDTTAMVSGFLECMADTARRSLIIPQYQVKQNQFEEAYEKMDVAMAAARDVRAKLEGEIETRSAAKGDGAKLLDGLRTVRATLNTAIESAQQFDDYLQAGTDDAKEARWTQMSRASGVFGSTGAGVLLLWPSQFGASSSNISRAFGSDKLGLQATVQLTYQLVDANGVPVATGVVSSGTFKSTTLADAGDTLGRPLRKACDAEQ